MKLNTLKPNTKRPKTKRVGRGGKRGTTSGHGTKGQKSRAGASVRPGFRGGDNRIWQLFPKQRGASKKPGNSRPHRKHRFFRLRAEKAIVLNLGALNAFHDGDTVTLGSLASQGLVANEHQQVKILGGGTLNRKLTLKGLRVSRSVQQKVEQAGGSVQE